MYLFLSAVFLTLAAAVGFNPLWYLIKKLPARMKFVWIHGGLALIGLIFFIYHVIDSKQDTPWLSFLILVVTAMGGIGLFTLRRTKAPVPAGIALIHPLAGAVGLALLLQAVFGN